MENTATQVTNDRRDKTNTVTNPLKEINPTKDVTVQVGGDSIDGKSVYLNHTFLYRLDSSILPGPRLPDRHGLGRHGPAEHRVRPVPGQLGILASRDLYRDARCRGQGRKSGQRLDS